MTATLAACGVAAGAENSDDPFSTEFRATVDVTTVEEAGDEVFGEATDRTVHTTIATKFGVRFPNDVSVESVPVDVFSG